MNRQRAIEQIERLAELLDRARTDVRSGAHGLEAVLEQATRSVDALGPLLASAGLDERQALLAAAARARTSQAALEQTLREEMAHVREQLEHLDAIGGTPPVRNASAPVATRRFERVG